jgi:hypothetical protein
MHSAIGCFTPIMSHELLKLKTTLWWRAAIEVFLDLDLKKNLFYSHPIHCCIKNYIGGVMLRVLASYAVYVGFDLRLAGFQEGHYFHNFP